MKFCFTPLRSSGFGKVKEFVGEIKYAFALNLHVLTVCPGGHDQNLPVGLFLTICRPTCAAKSL